MPFPYLCMHPVVAKVRPDGSQATFTSRTFDLMLNPMDDAAAKLREARRTLRQFGYQAHNIRVGGPFNDAESQP